MRTLGSVPLGQASIRLRHGMLELPNDIRQFQPSVARQRKLPADLRQGAQPADLHLEQRMLARLLG